MIQLHFQRQDLAPKQRIENISWALLNYFHHALTQMHTPFEVPSTMDGRWLAPTLYPTNKLFFRMHFDCLIFQSHIFAKTLQVGAHLKVWTKRWSQASKWCNLPLSTRGIECKDMDIEVSPSLPSLITEVPIVFSLEVPASIDEGPQTKKQCQETLSYPLRLFNRCSTFWHRRSIFRHGANQHKAI